MHNAPGAYEGYVRMAEVSETFQNEICARSLLTGHGPDPVEAAHRVCCPTLLLVCEYDNLVSPDSHVRAAQILGEKVQVEKYPIGHFDIYEGQHFEKAVDTKIAFLRAHFPQQ